jgi:hypothetical protein
MVHGQFSGRKLAPAIITEASTYFGLPPARFAQFACLIFFLPNDRFINTIKEKIIH